MSEKDIRAAIHKVCSELDGRARPHAVRLGARHVVLPILLGAGLAAPACDGDVESDDDDGVQTGSPTGTGMPATGTPQPAYGVPGGYGPFGGSGGVGGEAGAGGAESGGGGVGGGTGGAGGVGFLYMAPDP